MHLFHSPLRHHPLLFLFFVPRPITPEQWIDTPLPLLQIMSSAPFPPNIDYDLLKSTRSSFLSSRVIHVSWHGWVERARASYHCRRHIHVHQTSVPPPMSIHLRLVIHSKPNCNFLHIWLAEVTAKISLPFFEINKRTVSWVSAIEDRSVWISYYGI